MESFSLMISRSNGRAVSCGATRQTRRSDLLVRITERIMLAVLAGAEDQRAGHQELQAGPGRGHGLRLPGQLQLQRGVRTRSQLGQIRSRSLPLLFRSNRKKSSNLSHILELNSEDIPRARIPAVAQHPEDASQSRGVGGGTGNRYFVPLKQ